VNNDNHFTGLLVSIQDSGLEVVVCDPLLFWGLDTPVRCLPL